MVEEDAGMIEALHASSPKAFWIDFLAGTVGGVAGVVVGHPLDTVKVRLQAQAMTQANQRKYSGVVNCVATILKEEKFKGLYKGMASPIVGVAAINSLLFGVHGWFMHHLAGENTPSVANIFWAGCGSGFVNAFLSCPMELVKIRLQNQSACTLGNTSTTYSGNLDCIRKLYVQGGLRSFYRGLHVTLWRETPSYGAYFASYEIFSHLFTPEGQRLDVPSAGLLVAGGLAGIVGWLSTYPLDVIKTHIQSDLRPGKPMGLVQAARNIYAREGVRPFFAGLGATAVRAFPTNAATFYVVSLVTRVSTLETTLLQNEAANLSLIQQIQKLQLQNDLLRQNSNRIQQRPLEYVVESQAVHFHEPIRLPPVGQMVKHERDDFKFECGGTPPMDSPNQECKKRSEESFVC
ncbi:hypothetical protein HDU98_000369 [Podochytrium sp. JEL0797]|nr:hypothetical protein HDU98_000369 [Podochytrium sp. JEL0797]